MQGSEDWKCVTGFEVLRHDESQGEDSGSQGGQEGWSLISKGLSITVRSVD